MTEESSPAEPPDIRPCRISNNNTSNNVHTLNRFKHPSTPSTALEKGIYHQQFFTSKPVPTNTHHVTPNKLYNAIHGFLPIILLLIAINFLPYLLPNTTSTLSTPVSDPYTSYPARTRPTPLLTTIKAIFTTILNLLNIDHATLSQHEKYQMVKRLSTTETVEACMIPVLVVLSGIFAGLTLG
jgi:hypothetical protein